MMSALMDTGAITAAYVDKPGSGLVMQMLAIASALSGCDPALPTASVASQTACSSRSYYYTRETGLLSIQIISPTAKEFTGQLALHFFYLNISKDDSPGYRPRRDSRMGGK